jgi:hypothetical protein
MCTRMRKVVLIETPLDQNMVDYSLRSTPVKLYYLSKHRIVTLPLCLPKNSQYRVRSLQGPPAVLTVPKDFHPSV